MNINPDLMENVFIKLPDIAFIMKMILFQGWIKAGRLVREAFQTKKQGNLGNGPNRGGVVKKSKKSQVSVGKSSKLGGVLRKSKKSQVPECTKDQ